MLYFDLQSDTLLVEERKYHVGIMLSLPAVTCNSKLFPFFRHQVIEIDNVLLWLAMEFEKQTALINEYEQERTIRRRRLEGAADNPDSPGTHCAAVCSVVFVPRELRQCRSASAILSCEMDNGHWTVCKGQL